MGRGSGTEKELCTRYWIITFPFIVFVSVARRDSCPCSVIVLSVDCSLSPSLSLSFGVYARTSAVNPNTLPIDCPESNSSNSTATCYTPRMARVDVSQGSQGFGIGIISDLGGTTRDTSWEVLGWD